MGIGMAAQEGNPMRHDRRHAGIDVSNWEGKIDFRKVRKAGIRIVYIKATQGQDIVDEEFERNYREARREGLRVGFYHYLTARTEGEARQQAEFFYSKIGDKEQQAKPAMDFEVFGALTHPEIHNISLQFLRELEARSGERPVIYADAVNASGVFDDSRFCEYPLWIAEYGVSHPEMENRWRRWSGWQYTDRGHVRGISGTVDRDYFREEILLH